MTEQYKNATQRNKTNTKLKTSNQDKHNIKTGKKSKEKTRIVKKWKKTRNKNTKNKNKTKNTKTMKWKMKHKKKKKTKEEEEQEAKEGGTGPLKTPQRRGPNPGGPLGGVRWRHKQGGAADYLGPMIQKDKPP